MTPKRDRDSFCDRGWENLIFKEKYNFYAAFELTRGRLLAWHSSPDRVRQYSESHTNILSHDYSYSVRHRWRYDSRQRQKPCLQFLDELWENDVICGTKTLHDIRGMPCWSTEFCQWNVPWKPGHIIESHDSDITKLLWQLICKSHMMAQAREKLGLQDVWIEVHFWEDNTQKAQITRMTRSLKKRNLESTNHTRWNQCFCISHETSIQNIKETWIFEQRETDLRNILLKSYVLIFWMNGSFHSSDMMIEQKEVGLRTILV